MRCCRGQASADYVAVIAVVAIVLAVGGAAVRAPELPAAVVQHVRVALCIVGGDICRTADARAQGLEPCVVQTRDATRRTSMTFLFVRAGQEQGYVVEMRSDGSSRLVATSAADLGASGEPGLRLGPNVTLKAGGAVAAGWRSGVAWELADGAALRRLIGQAKGNPAVLADDRARDILHAPAPTERFFEGGEMGELTAGAQAYSANQPAISAGRRRALGRRVRRGQTSWYFDASGDGPRLFGGLIPEVELKGTSGWTLEVTEDAEHHPRALQLQTTIPSRHAAQVVELTASLDLTRPGNAAAARDLLALESSHTPLALARARAVGRHLLQTGTVERRVYRVRDRPSDFDAGFDIGVFGGEHTGEAHQRDLVTAQVLGSGSPARRADCLGL